MKKIIACVITTIALNGLFSCGNDNRSAKTDDKIEQSDTTYMENADNNGQPTTDHDGGTVTETKGAPESGYGNANNTELQPSNTGSEGSAAGRGEDDK